MCEPQYCIKSSFKNPKLFLSQFSACSHDHLNLFTSHLFSLLTFRSSLPQTGSTQSGWAAPCWPPSPLSSRCVSANRNTMSPAPTSSTASAPEGYVSSSSSSAPEEKLKMLFRCLWFFLREQTNNMSQTTLHFNVSAIY